jgi:hypothetical protein
MANMMGLYFTELAKAGIITGNGPHDPKLRAEWLETHEPNSVRVGGTFANGVWTGGRWVSHKGYAPLSTIMSEVADFSMIMDQVDVLTMEQVGQAITFSIIENFGQSTWWPNMSHLVGAVQGGVFNDSGLKAINAPFVSVLTGGPALQRVGHVLDPAARETRGFLDEVLARQPGYAYVPTGTGKPVQMPARRYDRYGKPLEPAIPVGSPWFGILGQTWPKTKDATTNRVAREGDRVQVSLEKGGDWVGSGKKSGPYRPGEVASVQLSVPQVEQRELYYRNMVENPTHGIVATLLDIPAYQNATLAGKRDMFEGSLRGYRSDAEELLRGTDKDLNRKLVEAELAGQLQQLPEADRPAASDRVQEGLTLFEKLTPDARVNLQKWGEQDTGPDAEPQPLQLRVAPVRPAPSTAPSPEPAMPTPAPVVAPTPTGPAPTFRTNP